MKRFLLLFWAVVLAACSHRSEPGGGAPPTDRVKSAVTYTAASDASLGFGAGAVAGIGEDLTVPAGETVLTSFGFAAELVAGFAVKGFVYGWAPGTSSATTLLWESPPLAAASNGPQDLTFAPNLALTAGQTVLVFVTWRYAGGGGPGTPGVDSNVFHAASESAFALGAGHTLQGAGTDYSTWAPLGGDAAFHAAFAAPLLPTSTTLDVTPGSPVVGQAVTLTATVAPAGGGSVTFFDGAASLGSGVVSGGVATLATSALAVGPHALSAVYGGDATHATSTSTSTALDVAKGATSASVLATPSPSPVGGVVTLQGTVAAVAPAAGSLAGTATVREGGATVCSGAVAADGTMSCTASGLTLGTHTFTLSYAGNASFDGATSAPYVHEVELAGTALVLTASPEPSVHGGAVTLTATVSASVGTPAGEVTFFDGPTSFGAATLTGGVASIIVSTLSGGTHTLGATYLGSSSHASVTGSTSHVVDRATATVLASASPTPSGFGDWVTLTAVVGAGGSPTGTVTFRDGGGALGVRALVGGVAILVTTSLAVGEHEITVAYSGDTNFVPTVSAPITHEVERAETMTTVAASGNPTVVGQPLAFTATVSAGGPGSGVPAGTVTFVDGATTLGVATLDAAGVATLSAGGLAVGERTVVAQYGGGASWAPSASPPLVHEVTPSGVSVTAAAAPNPSTFGASVTFTATVGSTSAGTPTGTVTFLEGAVTLGAATLSGGVATFTPPTLTGGPHTISARYEGDAAHAGGATATVVATVDRATTTTVLVPSVSPSVFGQPVTLRATITGAVAGAPSGSVTFRDGGLIIGTCTVGGGGCSLTTSALGTGTHDLTAAYSGDVNFQSSGASSVSHAVERSPTAIEVVSSTSPSLLGAPVTFSVTVVPVEPGGGVPSGMVVFRDGAVVLGSSPLSGDGVASFVTSSLDLGAHTIGAEYVGSVDHEPITGTMEQRVSASAATIAVTSSPSPSAFGAEVTVRVVVRGTAGTPSGQVTFRDGRSTMLGEPIALDAGGVATLRTARLAAGARTITARYGGDSVYATATGSVAHVVEKAATTTALTSSANPVATGAPVTLTAAVSAAAEGATGQVEFVDGETSLGAATLSGGVASLTTSALAIGEHSIAATYRGTANFAASTSARLVQVVVGEEAAPSPDGAAPPGSTPGAGASVEGDGCACRAAPAPAAARAAVVALGLVAVAAARRRRRGH